MRLAAQAIDDQHIHAVEQIDHVVAYFAEICRITD